MLFRADLIWCLVSVTLPQPCGVILGGEVARPRRNSSTVAKKRTQSNYYLSMKMAHSATPLPSDWRT